MLTLLDELIRTILMNGVPGLVPSTGAIQSGQVGFEPPDDEWRKHVSSLLRNALNVYLLDLRENRKLRSNERTRSIENGIAVSDPAPARLDCHYLITAWTPGTFTPGSPEPTIEPTLDEHTLLYQTAALLTRPSLLIPSRVYPPNSPPLNKWPERFHDVELPAVVTPVEGFGKLAEFWGTMGQKHVWKPVLYLIVTIPIELTKELEGPMVTTRITEYRHRGRPETAETRIEIGGLILAGSLRQPASGAWVQLELPSGTAIKTTTTDAQGRFRFAGLQQATYTLRVRVSGFVENERPMEVPSSTGEYDVHVT